MAEENINVTPEQEVEEAIRPTNSVQSALKSLKHFRQQATTRLK